MLPQVGDDLPRRSLGPEFRKLWVGQAISLLGTEITLLALPLTAVLLLEATPPQMGILSAIALVPYFLMSLFVGVWVDRAQRRPFLIAADIGRALLLGSIPFAALIDLLSIGQLYVVGFLVGILNVFFGVAYQSYLPSLVRRDQLAEANGRLAMSATATAATGPGIAGALVGLLTAPVAVAVDALSYVASALFVSCIRATELAPERSGDRIGTRVEIVDGLRAVVERPVLRALVGAWAVYEVSSSLIDAVLVLYETRELGIPPAVLGVLLTAGSVSAFLGAAVTGRVARLVGLGPSIGLAFLLLAVDGLLIALADVFRSAAIPLILAAEVVAGLGIAVSGVNQTSLRQALIPDRLRGRVNASFMFLTTGVRPVGALLGGFLGESIGLQAIFLVGALGMLAAAAVIFISPVRSVRRLSTEDR
jgi:MFS family permease